MRSRRLLVAALFVAVPLLSVFSLASSPAQAAGGRAPVKGAASYQFTAGGFTGKFYVRHFVRQSGHLMAQGTFVGTMKDKSGKEHSITQAGNLPVKSISGLAAPSQTLGASQPLSSAGSVAHATGSCNVLHLVLGPIYLNLLGLVVQTNQIVVDISGQQGPGNLLGNLICGIANLANGFPNLNQILLGDIALLLNQLLTGPGL